MPEIEEIRRRREAAQAMGGPQKVARQRASGRLTVRERIDRLADPGTFAEIGALTGFADYDEEGALRSVLPANFVAGTARIDGRPVLIGADDFTVRGGSGDAAIHAKQVFSEEYANQMLLPMVRLLDGASGGGSVKMAQDAGYTYVPVNPAWDLVVDNLSVIPVVALCLGPTVGLGAGRLVMSHLAVMVKNLGQLFTAGPPVVHSGTGEDLTKAELGGADVHRHNGTIERFADSEDAAFALARRFLSYLPGSVHELAPVLACDDPADRREEALAAAIPRLGAAVRGVRRRDGHRAGPAGRPPGRGHRHRPVQGHHDVGGGGAGGHPAGRPVRHVPPADRQPHRPGRPGHRPGRRGARHDPLRRPGDRRHVPGAGPPGRADRAPGLRGGRRRHRQPAPGGP
jgi:acetyl-CoA carboxylase carboxyltransferase component